MERKLCFLWNGTGYLKNHLTKHRLVCTHFDAFSILILCSIFNNSIFLKIVWKKRYEVSSALASYAEGVKYGKRICHYMTRNAKFIEGNVMLLWHHIIPTQQAIMRELHDLSHPWNELWKYGVTVALFKSVRQYKDLLVSLQVALWSGYAIDWVLVWYRRFNFHASERN